MKLCILADPDTWHVRDLKRAAGNHQIVTCSFDELTGRVGAADADCNSRLENCDCILARAMPAGSLQQIIFRMDVLLALESQGVIIVNPPRTIEMSVDKYLALHRLAETGIPVPITRVSQTLDRALAHFREFETDVVCKPIFGSGGIGLKRLAHGDANAMAAEDYFRACLAEGQVIYQQAFIDHGGTDFRLLVIGDEVLGMERTHPNHWITNIAQGATGFPHHPTEIEREMALHAARAVGASIAGVDLLYDANSGQPYILEINSSPSWRAISQVLQADVAANVIDFLTTAVGVQPLGAQAAFTSEDSWCPAFRR